MSVVCTCPVRSRSNSLRVRERRVHERCTDSGRSTLNRRDSQVACIIWFTHFPFFFRTLYLLKETIVLSVLYPPGIALNVGNTAINDFQIG